MNVLFGIDIIINFNSAYYDSDFQVVDSNSVRYRLIKFLLAHCVKVPFIMVLGRHNLGDPF